MIRCDLVSDVRTYGRIQSRVVVVVMCFVVFITDLEPLPTRQMALYAEAATQRGPAGAHARSAAALSISRVE